MKLYRQSIIIFGFVLPLLVTALIVGTIAFARNKISASYNKKSNHYASYQTDRRQALGIEARISKKRDHVSNWTTALREEPSSLVSSNLREISKHLPSKEFQQTSFSRPNAKSGFGTVSAQESVPLELSFRATFRSMQRACLELESRLPQLQLHNFRIDRTPQSPTLNFQVTYTAWEE